MSLPTGPDRDEHLRRHAVEERSPSIRDRCRYLALHAGARAYLELHGQVQLARGAMVVASVTALTLAVSPAETEAEFADKLHALRAYVGSLPEPHGAHVCALAEAALAAEAALRMSTGRPPHGLRIGGWMDDVPTSRPQEMVSVPPDDIELYATAGTAWLVDVALDRAILIVGELVGLAKRGEPMDSAYDLLEQVAFTLCAEPATTRAAFEDPRRTRQILWRTLRRRRPIAAAVIRTCLLHDGRRSRVLREDAC